MNYFLVQKLIYKDWYFQRPTVLGSVLLGFLALLLVGLQNSIWFTAGSILLLTVIIAFGGILATSLVVGERSTQTRLFILSLPISMREYTTAKMISSLLIFLIPWTAFLISSYILITNQAALPDGFFAFVLVVLLELLLNYCLLLSISVITESQGWASFGIIVGNLTLNAFIFYVGSLPDIKTAIASSSMVWNSTLTTILLLEVMVILALLSVTFYVQSRKKDLI